MTRIEAKLRVLKRLNEARKLTFEHIDSLDETCDTVKVSLKFDIKYEKDDDSGTSIYNERNLNFGL